LKNAIVVVMLINIRTTLRIVCTKVYPNLIADQRNFRAKYLQNFEENWKSRSTLSHFSSFNI